MRTLSFLSVLFLLSSTLVAQQPTDAEYAMRWDGDEGGPQTAKQVLEALGKEAEESKDYEILYFDFKPPGDAPAGFKSILRQRKSGKKYELTFKYRGDHPLSKKWKCPLSGNPDRKEEVDVSILAKGEIKNTYSYSCTVESKDPIAPPKELKANPKACSSKMTRYKSGDLKIEEWHLPGDNILLEVSQNGANTLKDLIAFHCGIVDELLKAGAKPSDRSKTELGSDCQ